MPDDKSRVDWAASFLEGKAQTRWDTQEEFVGYGRTSWEEFIEFIRNCVMDKANRLLVARGQYIDAKQKVSETVEAFVLRLEQYERDLGYLTILPENYRRDNLVGRLRPEIVQQLSRTGEDKKPRVQMIAAAERVEISLNLTQTTLTSKVAESRRTQLNPREQRGQFIRRETVAPRTLSDANTTPIGTGPRECHYCHKTGHIMTYCPEVKCFRCNKMGHTSRICDQKETETAENEDARS